MAALHFIAEMRRVGVPASTLAQQFKPVPQLLRNVRYALGKAPLDAGPVKAAIAEAEARLRGKGRLLIRKSGTEPLIRVMAECEDDSLLVEAVEHVVGAVTAEAG
jgi:phosphoglucosamine mutase